MEKYYLKIEARYSYVQNDEVTGETNIYKNEFAHSHLFDDEEGCIALGNKLIKANKWMEQFPSYKNTRLDRKFGRPLVLLPLKNRAQIFISVEKLSIGNFLELDAVLGKFDIFKITKKL